MRTISWFRWYRFVIIGLMILSLALVAPVHVDARVVTATWKNTVTCQGEWEAVEFFHPTCPTGEHSLSEATRYECSMCGGYYYSGVCEPAHRGGAPQAGDIRV